MIPPFRPSRTLPSRSPARATLRQACLAGAAFAALSAAPALAQQTTTSNGDLLAPPAQATGDASTTPLPALGPPPLAPPGGPPPPTPAPVSPAGSDGLQAKEIYLEADTLADDKARKIVTAQGHVLARVEGRTLRAERLVYDTVSGLVRATGDVVIINTDGTIEYAQDTTLDDQLRVGVATGFAARLQQNVVVAAGAAIKRNENVTAFKSGIITPCTICKTDGVTPRTPSFAIKADQIVEDKVHRIVFYRHAVIQLFGVPIIYTPLLWTPDPTADRQSGFLGPKFNISKRRGFSYEQPYYVALSPYADLTIAPQFNTAVNPFLNLQYRERFYSGSLDIRVGYTHDELFDNQGRYSDDTNRSYILAQGRFDLTRAWEWGFGLERTTDPTLFRRYNVPDLYEDRGPFPADTDRLISQIYTRRIDDQSLISVSALSFQSLRAYGQDPRDPYFESNKPFPFVGPLIEARWDPKDPVLGGRLRFDASAVVLTRGDPVVSAFDPTGVAPLGPERVGVTNLAGLAQGGSALTYTDSRQIDGEVEWRRDFTLPGGFRLQPYFEARGDVYGVSDGVVTQVENGVTTTAKANGATTQGDATVALTASWPLMRQFSGGANVILEPIVQLAYTPRQKLDPNVPNEDSVAFEFDDTDLFSLHRLPGYDLYESGARANVGGRADITWGLNHSAEITAGRVFRTADDTVFLPTSGLRGTDSDYVYGATVSPLTGFSFFVRQRLDADTLAVRRDEVGVGLSNKLINAAIRYAYNESGITFDTAGNTQIGRTEDLTVSGGVNITRNWALNAAVTRDMRQYVFPVSQFILTYHNDCLRLDTIYTHDETYGGVIGTSDSVTVRLTLAILGDTNRGKGAMR